MLTLKKINNEIKKQITGKLRLHFLTSTEKLKRGEVFLGGNCYQRVFFFTPKVAEKVVFPNDLSDLVDNSVSSMSNSKVLLGF